MTIHASIDFITREKIVKEFTEGASAQDLAVKYGCSFSSVYRFIRDANVSAKTKRRGRNAPKFNDDKAKEINKKYQAGGTVEKLAKEYGTTASTICRTIRRVGGEVRTRAYMKQKFDDETAKVMRKKYEDGATLYDLVDEYGTHPTTISRNLKRVGVVMRPQNTNKGRTLGKRKPTKGLLSWLAS